MDADKCTGPMQPGSIGHALEVKRILLEMELALAGQNLELKDEVRKMLYGVGLVYIVTQRQGVENTTVSICEEEGRKDCPVCEAHRVRQREKMKAYMAKKK